MATTAQSNQTRPGASGPVFVLRLRKKTRGRYPLTRTRMTIGRARNCDIVLSASTGVSRRHARVLVVDDEVVVEDLGSRNGTFVNGKLTTRRTLKPGDRIAIGHYRLYFLNETIRRRSARPAESELTRLMRTWGRAAVTTDVSGCPLCHSSDATQDDGSAAGETGEHAVIDEGCYAWFNDPIVALAGNVGEPEGESAVPAPEPAADDWPRLDVVENAVGESDEDLDEDEIMARVERLVGLAPGSTPQRPARMLEDDDEPFVSSGDETAPVRTLADLDEDIVEEGRDEPVTQAPEPGHGDHGARDRIQSRKPATRRQGTRREGLVRRGRLR